MAFVKTIYLPDDLIENVKSIENFSNLVSELLREYFERKSFKNGIESQLENFKRKADRVLMDLKIEEERILAKKAAEEQALEEEMTTEQKKIEKEKNFINVVIKNAKELFNADITEDDVKEYRNGNYENLLDYLIAKGFVKSGDY